MTRRHKLVEVVLRLDAINAQAPREWGQRSTKRLL